jgi:hypothetical protein
MSRSQLASVSRSSSLQTRRTYTVTIRDRKVEARTEFSQRKPTSRDTPRPSHDRTDSRGRVPKYPPVTPKDQNRLSALRRDPSVASLLDMYDNHGHLDNKAFRTLRLPPRKSPLEMAALKSSVVAPPFASCSAVRNPAIKLAPQRAIYRGPKHSFGMIVSSFPFWFAINLSRTRREAGPGNDESMPSICLESRTDAVVGASNNALPSNRPPAGFTTRPAISSMAVEHSYTSNESSASNTQQPTKPEMRPAAEVFGFLLEKRQRSTSMPMSVVPTSNFLPATRNINLPANHTRTTSATAKISKPPVSLSNALQPAGISASAVTPSSNGSNLVDPSHTATATRASRIPRGRLSLQLNPETQLLTTSSKGPAPTLISNNYDMLRSATNTVERAHVATSHLTSASERDVTPAPKRSAHRRSASSGMSRQIPNSWRAVPATTGAGDKVEIPSGLTSGPPPANNDFFFSDLYDPQ